MTQTRITTDTPSISSVGIYFCVCMDVQAITLNRCYRFQIKGYTSINPARSHITLTSCKKGIISNIRLIAPGESPNTDGIDISASRDIQVLNSFIATGNVLI